MAKKVQKQNRKSYQLSSCGLKMIKNGKLISRRRACVGSSVYDWKKSWKWVNFGRGVDVQRNGGR